MEDETAKYLSPITLRYATSRGELWTWYWREWRQELWRRWLVYGVILAIVDLGAAQLSHPIGALDIVSASAVVLALFAFFAAYPQFSYKREERVIVFNAQGIDTRIGTKTAHRDWREIASVTDIGTHVVFTVAKSGNAFLVPARAFSDSKLRRFLLEHVASWRAAAIII